MSLLKKQLGLNSVAVIDIGSNSVRWVVYDNIVRLPQVLFNEKISCALGSGIELTGLLNQQGVELSYKAFKRFRFLMDKIGVNKIYAFATAAVRDALNGKEFINKAETILKISITILSGEQEAHYAALGIKSGFFQPQGLVADLGGGSLELSYIEKGDIELATSFPLGGLRLHDKANGRLSNARDLVKDCLSNSNFLQKFLSKDFKNFYAIGGIWRSIAKLHMSAKNYPLKILHGYIINLEEIRRFLQRIAKGDVDHLKGIENIAKNRRYLLAYGAIVLGELLSILRPQKILISSYGIREGCLYQLLPTKIQEQDPLLSFASEMSKSYSRSLSHISELIKWTEQSFIALDIKENHIEKRYREAACYLLDIGWRAEVDYKGVQAFDMIVYGGIAGATHTARLFIACAVYYGNQLSMKEFKNNELVNSLLSQENHKKAKILGILLSTATLLSAFNTGIISELVWENDDKQVTLVIPQKYLDLMGENLDKRLASLKQLISKNIECKISYS
ncbi:exopolyphosphatase [Bartonella sp. DGB1]|uniref:Ppx/GppA phosphatase family protein n=1 Tax=Bartonella sp. DGB1 TaxID=3239807 RepID=UPI0035236015